MTDNRAGGAVDNRDRRLKKAMILAAGQGTRLRPLTASLPKCMVPIAGKPLLEHTIRRLRTFGVEEVMINLAHLPEAVINHFGDGGRWGVKISYSVEDHPLGTAGGVKRVEWFFDGPFIVWYGDNLSTCDLDRLAAFHAQKGGAASIAVFHRDDPTPGGIVALDEHDRILRILEKPRPDQVFSHWVIAGIFVLEPVVVVAVPAGGCPDFGRDVFPVLLAQGARLYGYRMGAEEGLWWIDTPEDLRRVQQSGPIAAQLLGRPG